MSVETSTQNPETHRKIGRWYLGETIGKGGYSWVKKGYDCKTGNSVALKFMDKKILEGDEWSEKQIRQVSTEIEALKQLKHSHIAKLIAYNLDVKYPSRDGSVKSVILLVLEYMPGGELFDILYYTQALEEVLARTYFKQLIEGVEYCHNSSIVHRDIKPQNLLLDTQYSLKLTDFGLAKVIESDNDAIMQTFHVGTRGYQAPELLETRPYTNACDIFSIGVVLFMLLTGYPPFEHAKATDKWYNPIINKDYKLFWKQHKGCGIEKETKDLITRMLLYNPEQRITINAIKQHPWYQKPILSQEELYKVLRFRHTKMELKRAVDVIKQETMDVSELVGRHLFGPEHQTIRPPILPEGASVGLLDVFTTNPGEDVLCYICEIAKKQFRNCNN